MFEETVLILGAGASCHYGYPTGNQLIENIIKTLEKEKIYYGYEDVSLSQLERETKAHMTNCRRQMLLIEIQKYKTL